MSDTFHGLNLKTDPEGWDYAECDCEWQGPPCPDRDTAAEFWADHMLAENDRLSEERQP